MTLKKLYNHLHTIQNYILPLLSSAFIFSSLMCHNYQFAFTLFLSESEKDSFTLRTYGSFFFLAIQSFHVIELRNK